MEEARLTFREHLLELRKRLLYAVAYVAAGTALALLAAERLYDLLRAPMVTALPKGASFIVTGPIEYFVVLIKLGITAGIFVASPGILHQVWLFVAPGLYKHERRYAGGFVVAGALFFVLGALFCYFVVFPAGLGFLVRMAPPDVLGMYRVDEYYGFAMGMLLAFGAAFEMPVIVVLLCLLGVVTPAQFAHFRKYAFVLAFVVGGVLTPGPDVISQLAMAVPLYLLYESGIVAARLLGPRRTRASAQAAAASPAPPDDAPKGPTPGLAG